MLEWERQRDWDSERENSSVSTQYSVVVVVVGLAPSDFKTKFDKKEMASLVLSKKKKKKKKEILVLKNEVAGYPLGHLNHMSILTT